MSKILMIVGSDRKHSFNAQLAREIVKEIGDRAETEFLAFSNIPFINQDEEFPAPESVEEARKAFKEADGVWLLPLSIMPRILAVSKTFLTGFPVEPKRA